MFPSLQWDELFLKIWSRLNNRLFQGCVQFWVECDPVQYENKIEISKTIPKRPLAIKCNIRWIADLKELKESLRSWFNTQFLRKNGK